MLFFKFRYSLRDFFVLKNDNFSSTAKAGLFIDEARNRTARLDIIIVVQEKDYASKNYDRRWGEGRLDSREFEEIAGRVLNGIWV